MTRSSNVKNPETPDFPEVATRFWAKVQRGDSCWLWVGGRFPRGYGQFLLNGRPEGAHRVAWLLSHGPIPEGQHVLHTCDVRACVNPAHLFLGTHADNMRDAAAKGRLRVPRPGARKLTDDHCAAIVALVHFGAPQHAIARQFGVSKAFVSMLVRGLRRQLRYRKAA